MRNPEALGNVHEDRVDKGPAQMPAQDPTWSASENCSVSPNWVMMLQI